jgi:hypothetical protein
MRIEAVFLEFIQFHATIKLFHFQTSHYGAHKASDKLFGKFAKTYDKFLEVYQGKYGRLPRINGSVKILSLTDKSIVSYCQSFVKFLLKASKETCNVRKNSDLCNILDEMIADINQFLYLLTFK